MDKGEWKWVFLRKHINWNVGVSLFFKDLETRINARIQMPSSSSACEDSWVAVLQGHIDFIQSCSHWIPVEVLAWAFIGLHGKVPVALKYRNRIIYINLDNLKFRSLFTQKCIIHYSYSFMCVFLPLLTFLLVFWEQH